MNIANPDSNIVSIIPSFACAKDKQLPNTFAKSRRSKPGAEVTSLNKRKKNIPKNIYIIPADKDGSREVVAKAMAEMYRRMLNPV